MSQLERDDREKLNMSSEHIFDSTVLFFSLIEVDIRIIFFICSEEIFYCGGSEALAQVSQKSLIPGNVQGLVEQDFEQPSKVEGLPVYGSKIGTRRYLRSLSTETIL